MSQRNIKCLSSEAAGEEGAGPSYEEMADAASETGASVLTGMSIYTDASHVGGPGGSSASGGSGAASFSRAPSTQVSWLEYVFACNTHVVTHTPSH